MAEQEKNVEFRRFDKKESSKVKGIAICLLLFHHLFYSESRIAAGGGLNLHLLSQENLTQIAVGTRVCVWIFAFISAYGLTIQYNRTCKTTTGSDIASFLKKHWLSLMKPYWFVFSLVMILSLVIFKRPEVVFENSWLNAGLSFFGLSDFFGTPMPTSVWWYMCFAQIVLLLVPFLAKFLKKYDIAAILLSFVLIRFLNFEGIRSTFAGQYINYFYSIIFGVWFANNGIIEKLGRKCTHSIVLQIMDAVLIVAVIVISIFIYVKYAEIDQWKFTKIFIALAASLIALLSYKYLTFKWLEIGLDFLGRHSGNIFLIHSFFYLYYIKAVYITHNVFLTWLLLMACSILVSLLIEGLKKIMRGTPFTSKLV